MHMKDRKQKMCGVRYKKQTIEKPSSRNKTRHTIKAVEQVENNMEAESNRIKTRRLPDR